ncbi:hypothetical protein SLS62_002557 [Diatrype stigma]|uniref:Glycosyltransferase family 28 N-terminal domain-containing protein n=1 Tax=Diatrype stigma TaxID=117547 RepID=A0AAN9YS18_9PEZI
MTMRLRFHVDNEHYNTKGKISRKDGRLNITVNDTSNTGYLAKALGTAVKKVVSGKGDGGKPNGRPTSTRLSSASRVASQIRRPKLNIVIMVIGSRGDIQPFLKVGKVLREEYGHRVRIATHPAFREFVEKDTKLEFFSVGGDPSELMAFMVKNPGMIPKLETVKAGDIGRRRASMAEMFQGFWRACINATDNEKDTKNLKMMGEMQPFIADAIIANPPSFAHIHCAEALGIPLHLMFTFPYTPTQAFPHPLATIKKSNVDPGYTNFISYPLVEMMVWQGLGDLVNDFRTKTLGLDPVSTLWAPGSTYRLHVPFTYLWSPGLIPKPEDWGDEIDVSGFVFLDLASSFTPPKELANFLNAGEMPVYIGFGSIVVDDPDHFTEMIFEAVKLAGVRALVSKGWGGLGQDDLPEDIYMLENTPHDWLFPRVRACVIHGGAGTTAIALKCGKPTMVVPFFGDQYFWGTMIGNAGAGPTPVPYKKLSAEALAEGIKFCLTDEARTEAEKIAKSVELEGDGAKNAVRSFHSHLPLEGEDSIRCAILADRVAVWKVKNTSLKLSAVAAYVLVDEGCVSWRNLRPIRHKEWNDFAGPGEPLTGIAGSLAGTVGDVFGGIGSVPYRLAKLSHTRAERRKKKEARRKQHQQGKQQKTDRTQNHTSTSTAPRFPFPDTGPQEDRTVTTTKSNGQPVTAPTTDGPSDDAITPALTTAATTPGTAGLTTDNSNDAQEEYFNEISSGVGRSGRALAHAPVDLSLALAQGFHNAPRLYGDDTVRAPTRVTGIRSGLRAARREFGYGVYDGVTGLVRLPVRGARERGVRGAAAGVAMGFTGFVLKDLAALFGPVGYALKGVAKQVERRGGTDLERMRKLVRRARIVQAQREMNLFVVGDGYKSGGIVSGSGGGGCQDGDTAKERKQRDKVVREEVLTGWGSLCKLADLVAAAADTHHHYHHHYHRHHHHHGTERGLFKSLFSHHRHRRSDTNININNNEEVDGVAVNGSAHADGRDVIGAAAGTKAKDSNGNGNSNGNSNKKKSSNRTPLGKFTNASAHDRRLFESVDVARRAIDAITRGDEDLDAVVFGQGPSQGEGQDQNSRDNSSDGTVAAAALRENQGSTEVHAKGDVAVGN